MDIEDDFIDDSSASEEQSEEPNSLFLTASHVEKPKEIILKPAVNVYPLTSLSQQLLSMMYSLVMFGKSDIGTTVSGSVYELGSHLTKMRNTFPDFVKEINIKSNSRIYKLQKQLNSIKERKVVLKEENLKLKYKIRSYSKQIPKCSLNNDIDDEMPSESERAYSELKAVTTSMKKAIIKLRELNQQNEETIDDNKKMQNEIEQSMKKFRSKCNGDVGKISKSIVNIDVEIQNNIMKHKENIANAIQIVDSYRNPVLLLEARLQDLNKRIMQTARVPLTGRSNWKMGKLK